MFGLNTLNFFFLQTSGLTIVVDLINDAFRYEGSRESEKSLIAHISSNIVCSMYITSNYRSKTLCDITIHTIPRTKNKNSLKTRTYVIHGIRRFIRNNEILSNRRTLCHNIYMYCDYAFCSQRFTSSRTSIVQNELHPTGVFLPWTAVFRRLTVDRSTVFFRVFI